MGSQLGDVFKVLRYRAVARHEGNLELRGRIFGRRERTYHRAERTRQRAAGGQPIFAGVRYSCDKTAPVV
ncbi:hypothetical protein D3C72_2333990 [compost metagenome]